MWNNTVKGIMGNISTVSLSRKEQQARKIAILEKNNELLTEANNKLAKSNAELLERAGWLEGQLNLFLTQVEGSA